MWSLYFATCKSHQSGRLEIIFKRTCHEDEHELSKGLSSNLNPDLQRTLTQSQQPRGQAMELAKGLALGTLAHSPSFALPCTSRTLLGYCGVWGKGSYAI